MENARAPATPLHPVRVLFHGPAAAPVVPSVGEDPAVVPVVPSTPAPHQEPSSVAANRGSPVPVIDDDALAGSLPVCVICQDGMDSVREGLETLPCGHVLHEHCLGEWRRLARRSLADCPYRCHEQSARAAPAEHPVPTMDGTPPLNLGPGVVQAEH